MKELSIIITVYNEEENIKPMIERVTQAMGDFDYELLFVNDGSKDKTLEMLEMYATDKVRIIDFMTNRGQSIAMRAGIENSEGRYLAFLDGDLQNDPDDILPMLNMLKDEDMDVVMGYRKDRKDNAIIRNFPSKIANGLIRKVTKIQLKDGGCSLRVFKREYAEGLDLYGELHRFIPVLTIMQGAKVKQIPVRHHERMFGTSKYGLSRIFKVLPDLLFIYFIKNYRLKPMHFFGKITFILLTLALLSLLLLLCSPFYVALSFFTLFTLSGVIISLMGIMAEVQMRTYYSHDRNRLYQIKNGTSRS